METVQDVAYTSDSLNCLPTVSEDGDLQVTYTYDANGNTLQVRSPTGRIFYRYDGFNRLSFTSTGKTSVISVYNAQGIRISKVTPSGSTYFLLDGSNVAAEVVDDEVTATYLRGANLITRNEAYYLFNAHGDVVNLTSAGGIVTKSYAYDAFGNEKNPSISDHNPFRYCGEYFDSETGTYYLRARYYDPAIGRFTQQDTHWNVSNMIYGDNPRKINAREDALGLKAYTHVPQITTIIQSGNLYVYGIGNPVMYADPNGHIAITTLILVGSIAVGLVAAGITAYRSYQYTGKIDWENTILTGLSWFSLAYTLGTSAYTLYASYCNYSGYAPVSEVHFNSSAKVSEPNGRWMPVNEAMSDASKSFQTQVTGHTGEAYVVNGVKFDGISKSGHLIEVKNNYANFINPKTGEFHSWFRGKEGLITQATRQLNAAGGVPIDWYFSDLGVLNAVKQLFANANINEINFMYQAPK